MRFLGQIGRATIALAVSCLCVCVTPSVGAERSSQPATVTREAAPIGVEAVVEVGFTVRDMDRSVKFFTDVLSFEKLSDEEVVGRDLEQLSGVFGARTRRVRLQLGEETLALTEYLAPRGRSLPEDARANDRTFQHVAIVVRDIDIAYRRLREHKVEYASTGPQRIPDWNKAAAGIEAFYFRDPDGHFLELIHFPIGKGSPKWQQPGDRLFLGIDHTAIVVANTSASLRFYRDLLGLSVVGESENSGTEQEHLNNVRGAQLRITSLRAAKGPGVELLEYLAPRHGQQSAAAVRANDLLYWQTTFRVANADATADALRKMNVSTISERVVAAPYPTSSETASAAFVARDPDGHAVEFTTLHRLSTAPVSIP
jgi:catechol 2,3-dioxygenase-like lactoylglutathione lyase family enzyme